MEYSIKSLESFHVIGISVRTTNQNSQSDKDIGSLWQRFTEGNLAAQINDKLSDDIYCVYTEYESDHTGFYTAILGCKIKGGSEAPRGFVSVNIPAGTYQVYKPKGKFPESIANAWREIWKAPISRKYTADFDLYKAGPKSFEETEVEIYLAV
ncbi:MAG TPA: GyrI-like domain-containing protein [Mucilaginibacter sp.]|nr:GyrI-like domain-containing protein [Mucilaginibacter sp.]